MDVRVLGQYIRLLFMNIEGWYSFTDEKTNKQTTPPPNTRTPQKNKTKQKKAKKKTKTQHTINGLVAFLNTRPILPITEQGLSQWEETLKM